MSNRLFDKRYKYLGRDILISPPESNINEDETQIFFHDKHFVPLVRYQLNVL